ncbi:MAG: hypothetical protein ACRCTZ_14680 [Sarcina sp.]
MDNNKEKPEIKPTEVFEKIEFRTMRASKKSNTGTVIVITPAASGDMIWEMAKLKGFNQNDKPTFNYDNKTIFGLSQLEAAKISIVINRYLASCNRPKQSIEFPHLTAGTPKKITFTFSATEDFKTKEKVSQMQVNVFHPSNNQNQEGENYNIYLNEDEMYVVKQFLDAQINPALRRVTCEAFRSLKMDKDTNMYKDYTCGLIENVNNIVGGGNEN